MPALPTTVGAYSTGHWMTTCGADGGHTEPEILEFGFVARGLYLLNTCADPLYCTLTTDPASTSAPAIPGGGTFQAKSVWTSGLSLRHHVDDHGGLPATGAPPGVRRRVGQLTKGLVTWTSTRTR